MSDKEGVNCMYCGSDEVVKNGTRAFSRRYKCKNCNKQFSLHLDDSLNIYKMLNMLDACTNFTQETTAKEMRQKIMGVKQLMEIIPKIKEVKEAVRASLRQEEYEETDHPMDRICTLSPAEFNNLEDKLVREKERRLRSGENVWSYTRFKKRANGTYYNASSEVILENNEGTSITNEDYKKYEAKDEDDDYDEDDYDDDCEEEEEEEIEQEGDYSTQLTYSQKLQGYATFLHTYPKATFKDYIRFINKKDKEGGESVTTNSVKAAPEG